jgi:PAS domain S-box-containing protein
MDNCQGNNDEQKPVVTEDDARTGEILRRILPIIYKLRDAQTAGEKFDLLAEGIRLTGWQRVHLYVIDFSAGDLRSAASKGLTEEQVEKLRKNPLKLKDIEYIFQPKYEKFKIGRSYYFPYDCGDGFIEKKRATGVHSSIHTDKAQAWHPEDILYFPILDLYGKIMGVVSVDDPISGEKPTEESLSIVELLIDYATAILTETEYQDYFSKTRGLISRLFDLSPAMIFVIDEKNKIIDINDSVSKHLGYMPSDLINRNESVIFSSDVEFEEMTKGRKNGVYNGEVLLSKKDGSDLWGYASSVPVFDTNGKIDGYITSIVDITESKQLQRYLIRAEKLAGIGVLASGIAHEINNPLYAILGLAEELLTEKDLSPKMESMIDEIIFNTEEAATIVKNLSTYAYSAKTESSSSVDLNDVIKNAIGVMERTSATKGVIFDLDLAEVPSVQASTGEITQVIGNVLSNAVDSMPNGGLVSIKTRKVGNNVECRIRDTGTGIPEEVRDRVFDPFFTTKEVGSGTGLGLYVCYRILTKHRGSIAVENTSCGGTCFLITLPLSNDAEL